MADFTISLKAARINAELSKAEVAEKVGVSISSIANWECGRNRIGADKLKALSEVYKIPMDRFRMPEG